MAREHLEGREDWQPEASDRGKRAEHVFERIMAEHLKGSPFKMTMQPKSLGGIYGRHEGSNRPHGIKPECEIRNTANDRITWVEIKRQRAAGNAHERACKYFAPGIIESACKIGRHPEGVFPFWLIFTNGIATHSRYRQEITHWFRGYEANFTLWESIEDPDIILDHFDKRIKSLIA